MIALAGSVVVASCLGCSGLAADSSDVIRLDVGPVSGNQAFTSTRDDIDSTFATQGGLDFRLPLKVGNDFSPNNWAQPETASRFKAMDLSTPMPLRSYPGENWSAEMSFTSSGERTGLGVDLQLAPRAQIDQNRAGKNVARAGAEVRIGQGLADRDLRGTKARAPSWYFFVGADNEALTWNLADSRAVGGATLRDQATVGDLQAGIAISTKPGAQMSFGLVERKLKFNDIAGDHDVNTREQFAAFSFTLKR